LNSKECNFFDDYAEDEDDFQPPEVKISSNKISKCSHLLNPMVITKQKSNSIEATASRFGPFQSSEISSIGPIPALSSSLGKPSCTASNQTSIGHSFASAPAHIHVGGYFDRSNVTANPVIDLSGVDLKANFLKASAQKFGSTRDLTHFMEETSNFSEPDFDRDFDQLSPSHRAMILGETESEEEELPEMPELPRLQR
jgi:hypothetical protein